MWIFLTLANNFANPRRKVWRILGNPPGSRSGPFIEPGQLGERLPLIINMLLPFNPRPGLKNQGANALLSQFVSERTPPAPEPIISIKLPSSRSNVRGTI